MANLALPGNPRYQPKDLQECFGYDNLFRSVAEVEIATMLALGDIGVIPAADIALLTPDVRGRLMAITTSEVDKIEREVTKHDIRAWVKIAQERSPAALRRWIHIPLTSYDVLDTARSLQFVRAHAHVVRPLADTVIGHFAERTRTFATQKQIGRTHGQHALPITVGFWFATVLNRIMRNAQSATAAANALAGKISGAVGAYNAQKATGIDSRAGEWSIGGERGEDVASGLASLKALTFEELVLAKLGLVPAPISTQIMPPEPLADYLFSCIKLSAALGQFGRDGRHLMRSEIAELGEPFDKGQVGSSTMAHKRNPINFENLEGTWLKTKSEFGKVLDTLLSDHQRDLVGSSVARDFPTIVVNLVSQLNTLLRGDPPFIARISVDAAACERNIALQGDAILAEAIYITLQMIGYEGDAHELVNHRALALRRELASRKGMPVPSLYGIVTQILGEEGAVEVKARWMALPDEAVRMLTIPEDYTGFASAKAFQIADAADAYLQEQRS